MKNKINSADYARNTKTYKLLELKQHKECKIVHTLHFLIQNNTERIINYKSILLKNIFLYTFRRFLVFHLDLLKFTAYVQSSFFLLLLLHFSFTV